MFTPINDSFCVLPVFYRPTTVMLVDDDPDFLKQLSNQLSDQLPVITFTDPDKAIQYFENHNVGLFEKWLRRTSKDMATFIQDSRQEIYNPNRFKEIIVSVLDYDMPGKKSGFDVMNTMGEAIFGEMSFHSYILLTGKRFSEFDEKLAAMTVGKNFVSKWDPNRVNQLLDCIAEKSARAFQWISYPVARELSREPTEKTNFLFDGHVLPILNKLIQEHHICELYLFDKQGSYLLLDEHANLSWFFVRSDLGMVNSIELAKQYHAPSWVIDAIQSKEKLLSLYEKEDFDRLTTIDWENYLLPATVFKGDPRYMKAFNLEPHSDYYYAFTHEFAEHGIDQKRIVSYRSYLDTMD